VSGRFIFFAEWCDATRRVRIDQSCRQRSGKAHPQSRFGGTESCVLSKLMFLTRDSAQDADRWAPCKPAVGRSSSITRLFRPMFIKTGKRHNDEGNTFNNSFSNRTFEHLSGSRSS